MEETLEQFILQRMDSSEEMKLNRIFNKRRSPRGIIKLFKHDLQMENDEEDYFTKLHNSQLTLRNAFENSEKSSNESLAIRLKQMVKVYNKKCGQVSILAMILNEDEFSIAIVTPLMRRNHKFNPRSAQIVYVTSCPKITKYSSNFYQILTESEAGGIPLGVLITRNNSQFLLTQALLQYKKLIGNDGHFGNAEEGPLVWVGDECEPMELAWREIFPSSLHVINVCHIARTVWQKLLSCKPKPAHSERRILMSRLKRLLLCTEDKEVTNQFTQITNDVRVKKLSQLVSYLTSLYEIRTLWCLCFRPSLIKSKSVINPFQIYLRTTTSVIYDRICELNLIEIIRFVFDRLEKYYHQRIVDSFTAQQEKINWHRFVVGDEQIYKSQIKSIGLDEYLVKDEQDGECYHVDISIGVCQCQDGVVGIPCRHQFAVVKWFDVDVFGCQLQKPEEEGNLLKSLMDFNDNDSHGICFSRQVSNLSDKLSLFSERLKQKCEDNPGFFIPAVETFLDNYDVAIKCGETSLVSALYSFGKDDEKENVKTSQSTQSAVSYPLKFLYQFNNSFPNEEN